MNIFRFFKYFSLKKSARFEELRKTEERLKWVEKKCENLSWFDVSIFKIYFLKDIWAKKQSRFTAVKSGEIRERKSESTTN